MSVASARVSVRVSVHARTLTARMHAEKVVSALLHHLYPSLCVSISESVCVQAAPRPVTRPRAPPTPSSAPVRHLPAAPGPPHPAPASPCSRHCSRAHSGAESGRDRGRERHRDREEGREGGREGGRVGGWEGGREGGRVGERGGESIRDIS